ncbi:MAG: glycosyltransferase [Bacteroidales bacterium]|nr:glycosyltransferase [Bacteroidales bacterium]
MTVVAYIILIFTILQMLIALTNLVFETNLPRKAALSGPLVSVLIPARNEEKNIGQILDDILNQDYRDIEIIVFNDQSDDRTAEIVRGYSEKYKIVSLVNSPGLPDGWLGKNFACHSLSFRASGKYLLFIDADVRISDNAIGRAVCFAEKHGLNLISLFPLQKIITVGEKITVPNMNYILVSLLPLFLVRKLIFPSLAAANGQFMFFSGKEYREIMPHQRMKREKVEDILIARYYKRAGLKVACLLGDNSTTCRMYSGFRDSVNGFSKNVTEFFGGSFITAFLFWLVTTFGFIPVYCYLPAPAFILYLAAYILTRIFVSAASRQNLLHNLAFIIPLQISLGIFLYEAFLNRHFRKFQWKGRYIG